MHVMHATRDICPKTPLPDDHVLAAGEWEIKGLLTKTVPRFETSRLWHPCPLTENRQEILQY